MEIYFSRHAKKQLKWRDIGEDEVKEAVISPERIESSRGERKNAYKQIGGKRLKVTFMEESGRIVIITAMTKAGRRRKI